MYLYEIKKKKLTLKNTFINAQPDKIIKILKAIDMSARPPHVAKLILCPIGYLFTPINNTPNFKIQPLELKKKI